MYRPYSSPIGSFGSSMDVESTIRGLTQDFCMNFNTGNYDQVGGLFASDGSFMAPHHESAVGRKRLSEAARVWRSGLPGSPRGHDARGLFG